MYKMIFNLKRFVLGIIFELMYINDLFFISC